MDKPFEIIEPINLKIFFRAEEKQQHGVTYNHYGVIGRRQEGGWLNLLKNNGEEVLLNMANVNQIVTI